MLQGSNIREISALATWDHKQQNKEKWAKKLCLWYDSIILTISGGFTKIDESKPAGYTSAEEEKEEKFYEK